MIKYIRQLLISDTELLSLLGGEKVFLLDSELIEKQIIFNLVPASDDGVKRQYRLEITVIAFEMADIEAISDRVSKILITLGDEPKGRILDCNLNGGGLLRNYDTGTLHKKIYFNLLTRGE